MPKLFLHEWLIVALVLLLLICFAFGCGSDPDRPDTVCGGPAITTTLCIDANSHCNCLRQTTTCEGTVSLVQCTFGSWTSTDCPDRVPCPPAPGVI